MNNNIKKDSISLKEIEIVMLLLKGLYFSKTDILKLLNEEFTPTVVEYVENTCINKFNFDYIGKCEDGKDFIVDCSKVTVS